jgi:hypothetical protein
MCFSVGTNCELRVPIAILALFDDNWGDEDRGEEMISVLDDAFAPVPV